MSTPSNGDRPDALLSHGARTAISFLLFLHLFALAVAVFSNPPASGLLQGLRRAPGVTEYLQLLHMDLSYRFHLMLVDDLDMDYFIEADLQTRDGEQRHVVLPSPDLKPGIRYRRQERLAWQVAYQTLLARSGGSSGDGLVPQAIATTLLAENEAIGGVIRCRGHLLQSPEQAASLDPAVRDPYHPRFYRTVYEANVRLFDGEVLLVRAADRGETAPVADETEGAGNP